MSQLDWQNLAAIAVVSITLAYVARRIWRKLTRRNGIGCGTCGDCPAEKSAGLEVIGVQSLIDSTRKL